MMRSWENRSDTTVVDEPFYAHYLQATGLDHPMRDAVIANGETDWQKVVPTLTQRPSNGLFYQKHITTHWMAHFTTDWLELLDHVFLIRAPEPVIASYALKREDLTAADLGYAQQAWLFEHITSKGEKPVVVIDSQRFLKDPEAQLKAVCKALDVPFDPDMLSWPAGGRDSDGIWEAHWYESVKQSTGFAAARYEKNELSQAHHAIAEDCRKHYELLAQFAVGG